jgi:S1-C subfamily serine protease
MINNKTVEALGSGVTIKYNGQFYILSAGHMIDTKDDLLTFSENGQEIGELEIVKHEFSDVEDLDGFFDTKDLLLLRPKNKDLQPTYYTELTEKELDAPEQIYIVGSPAGIEDVLSDGRIIRYMNNFMYYINHTYYGNSGGGVFTRDGRLIGIVSHMFPIGYNYEIPPYMTYGAVRLNEIFEFLKDIE